MAASKQLSLARYLGFGSDIARYIDREQTLDGLLFACRWFRPTCDSDRDKLVRLLAKIVRDDPSVPGEIIKRILSL